MPHIHRLDPNRHRSFLEERRRDPITHEPLRSGDEIVICANENIAFLATNWNGCCPRCGSANTLNNIPSSIFPNRLGRQVRRSRPVIWPGFIILVIIYFVVGAIVRSNVWGIGSVNSGSTATAQARIAANWETRTTLTAQALIGASDSEKQTATIQVRATATAERRATFTAQALARSSVSQKQTVTAQARAAATAERRSTLTAQALADRSVARKQTATAQARATATATKGKTVSCDKSAQGEFADLWRSYKDLLGCPMDTSPLYGQFADMPFEKGHLFWIGNIDVYGNIRQVIVTVGGQNEGDRGSWSIHAETWDNEPICNVPSPPDGRYLPDRGIAKVWCEINGINALGYATAPAEFAPNRGINAIQNFDKAVVFRDSDGHSRRLVYILFRSSQTYVRVRP